MRPGPRVRSSVLLSALVVVAAMGPLGTVLGDPEALEQRLRAASVEASLRDRVRRAVERGAAFLASKQAADGSFAEHGAAGGVPGATRVTLWAALALRHAGTPAADAAAARAATWAFDGGEARLAAIAASVDDSGLALLLLLGTPPRPELTRRLAASLGSGLDPESGWWRRGAGAAPPPSVAAGPATPPAVDVPNLDSSQLAVLGLLAARALGVDVPTDVWSRHARGLVETQTAKYASWPRKLPGAGGIGETAGTLLGFANLVAAARVLGDAGGAPAGLAASIERAHSVLGRDAGRTLSDPLGHFEVMGDEEGIDFAGGRKPPFEALGRQSGRRDPSSPGDGAYARLFAVERACLFDDLEAVDAFLEGKSLTGRTKPKTTKLPCYATATKWLLSVQRKDGGFASEADDAKALPSETDTALALLVLTRAASAYHPTKPTPIDARPHVPVGVPAVPVPAPAMGG